jgi:hypothetical protein
VEAVRGPGLANNLHVSLDRLPDDRSVVAFFIGSHFGADLDLLNTWLVRHFGWLLL